MNQQRTLRSLTGKLLPVRSVYCSQEWQDFLVDNVQEPGKQVLTLLAERKLRLRHIVKFIRIFKALQKLPEPTRENIGDDPNHIILVDTRDEFFRHWNVPYYVRIFRYLFNLLIKFVICKDSFDHLYEGLHDWYIGELLRRGYKLPDYNVPNHRTWDKIPKETEAELRAHLVYNYGFLQERLKDSNDPLTKEKREEQFVNRIITKIEQVMYAEKNNGGVKER